jgi:glycosyltransferase involved in cell wall biosynthesis
MRVLYLCPVPPWPPRSGGRIRTWNLLRELAPRTELSLWTVEEPDAQPGQLSALQGVTRRVRLFARDRPSRWERFRRARAERWFHSSALRAALRLATAAREFDLVHLDEACLLPALPSPFRLPLVVHHHKLDLELDQATRAPRWELRKLRRLEREAARRTPWHVTCSREDALRLADRHPELRIQVVECGVDPDEFRPREKSREPGRLLFLGSLSYEPNLDGLEWFVREVFPRLRELHPGAHLRMVGERPGMRARELVRAGVELIGEVEDARAELSLASASIVPLRIGGGTRLKIPVALASGCPVVSTRTGAEGLGLVQGEHLLLADEADTFARAVALILERPARGARLALRGRVRARTAHAWSSLAPRLLQCWERALLPAPAAAYRSDRIRV